MQQIEQIHIIANLYVAYPLPKKLIFAGMKKYSAAIFLPLLVILAFLTAGVVPVEKTGTISLNIVASNNSFQTDLNYPNSEIERSNIHGTGFLHGHQGFQKIPGYLAVNTKARIISAAFSSSTVFPVVELFDNNYLSHNYPSHNFW